MCRTQRDISCTFFFSLKDIVLPEIVFDPMLLLVSYEGQEKYIKMDIGSISFL